MIGYTAIGICRLYFIGFLLPLGEMKMRICLYLSLCLSVRDAVLNDRAYILHQDVWTSE